MLTVTDISLKEWHVEVAGISTTHLKGSPSYDDGAHGLGSKYKILHFL